MTDKGAVDSVSEPQISVSSPVTNKDAFNEFSSSLTQEELLQKFVELSLQNEFLRSRLEDISSRNEAQTTPDTNELRQRIDALNIELRDEKGTRTAAEAAMEHLRESYAVADNRAQELAANLAEAQEILDREIKDRDAKYAELDSKLQRLHKRAKQRIQDVQKEKDDIEARFNEMNEAAERSSSQLLSSKQELERTRQQANDALKAMDSERQSLRNANNRLRDNLEELRRSMEPKENMIETLQQTIAEKDKMLDEMRGLLQEAENKRQVSVSEHSAKLQKIVESLESQLADADADRTKAAETVSSLQNLKVERDSKIAELEAASSGEAARLNAALDRLKGELMYMKDNHEKEKEIWEGSTESWKTKLEIAESNYIRAEIEAAKLKSNLESDAITKTQLLSKKEAELLSTKEELNRMEKEFSSYKIRAHSLLQKKDAEIAAVKDSEQLRRLEESLKETERELAVASAHRDKSIEELQENKIIHEKQVAERDEYVAKALQRMSEAERRLNSTVSEHQKEKREWEINMQNIEEMWRARLRAAEAETKASSTEELSKELEQFKHNNKKLKEENTSLRDLADKMIEEKDKEISRLLDDNKKLRFSVQTNNKVISNNSPREIQNDLTNASNSSVAEQQILLLARQQAKREEELAQSQRHILALEEEITELERENRLHHQQELMLKTEIREMERNEKREGVDMTYLKNVILKLLETGEVEALLPVVAMLLQFTPDEVQKCRTAYRQSVDTPTNFNDASATRTLFPRFSFS